MVTDVTIHQLFPNLNTIQKKQFSDMLEYYRDWNSKINVISRADFEFFYERHVLHSLLLTRAFDFHKAKKVLDIGTGGGFPGIPLAIMFPEVSFTLVDSIEKKIKVVNSVAESLGLKNVKAAAVRAETIKEKQDVVVSRAVAPLLKIYNFCRNACTAGSTLLCLKGGDLTEETDEFKKANPRKTVSVLPLKKWTDLPFFETKVVVVVR